MLDLENIDRTRAFTEEEMIEVRKLPRDQWIAAMARPNPMSEEENMKHYKSSNYPELRYGTGKGTLTPPTGKK